MVSDVRRDFDEVLGVIAEDGCEFPMAEFITSVGFFVVLLFEEVIRRYMSTIVVFMSPSSIGLEVLW